MATIKINLIYKGELLNETTRNVPMGLHQQAIIKNNLTAIQNLTFSNLNENVIDVIIGEDLMIDWNKVEIPDSARNKIQNCFQINNTIRELHSIISKLHRCKINESSEVQRLAELAMKIIMPLNNLTNVRFNISIEEAYQKIGYTVNKEVKFFQGLNHRDSEKKKREYRDNAVNHLEGEISGVATLLGSTEYLD